MAVDSWERARSEWMDGERVDSERQEANEEVLSHTPNGIRRYADADEPVGY